MAANQMSQADQQQLNRYQQMSQTLDTIVQQRITMEAQVKEADHALKELESAKEDVVIYKTVGGLFIKSDRDSLLQDTNDQKETLSMRIKSLNNNEERLKKQIEELREKVQLILKKEGMA